jgi:phospholipid/cholesterol/gamma-HCH transport system permease protein
MDINSLYKSNLYTIEAFKDNILKIKLTNDLKMSNINYFYKNMIKIIKTQKIERIDIDLIELNIIDDFILSTLFTLKIMCIKRNILLNLTNVKDSNKNLENLINDLRSYTVNPPLVTKQKSNIILATGNYTIDLFNKINAQLIFLGDIILSTFYLLLKPKHLRLNETILNIQKAGIEAIPIISLISFLMGLIMAFMSSIQLRQFGANIYVASLVGLAMARELAPIMTSIIVTGRSGSAFAAEIGTMKISEEVDALQVMGFDITKFLVIPKVIATVIVVPILTIISNICANIGGIIVGVGMLNLTFNSYVHQLYVTIKVDDFLHGIIKSAIFAFLIASVGCYRGLCVQKGTDDVGKATTSAVVSGIFLIILIDSLIAVILTYI